MAVASNRAPSTSAAFPIWMPPRPATTRSFGNSTAISTWSCWLRPTCCLDGRNSSTRSCASLKAGSSRTRFNGGSTGRALSRLHFAPSRGSGYTTWPEIVSTTPSDAAFLTDSTSTVCRSEEHTSELQSQSNLVCRLLLEKKKKKFNFQLILFQQQST